MANDDRTGLSTEEAPTAADVVLVDDEIGRFDRAESKERVEIFEGPLTNLAKEISERYQATKNHDWIVQLARISEATSLMAAEDISSVVEEFLVEPPGVQMLRRSRYANFAKDFSADQSIYADVICDDCLIVVVCNRFQVNGAGHPIFEGTMDLLRADRTVIESFDISTGGGAASHKTQNGPLPPGRYLATNFRIRNDVGGMIRDGIGYSVDLDPCDGTPVYGRDLFRIHPDGAPFGTRGCVGVQGNGATQRAARDLLRDIVAAAGGTAALKLCIRYSK